MLPLRRAVVPPRRFATTRHAAFRLIASHAAWLAGGMLALVACKADIPDGIYRCKDAHACPSGYSCRADGSGAKFCFAGSSEASAPDGGASESGGKDGGPGSHPRNDAGFERDASQPSEQRDGGPLGRDDGGVPSEQQVRPTALEFSSLGERRSGPGLVLSGDGFERGAQQCSADGVLCVTGGFVP
jgi:hypothetical protein